MSALKQLRLRLNGVKSTEKMTKAMKMVSASKLSKAQAAKDHVKPYANKMYNIIANLAKSIEVDKEIAKLIKGRKIEDTYLLVVMGSDKGLCGAFNSSVVRSVKQKIKELEAQNKKIKIWCFGKKVYEQLKVSHSQYIIEYSPGFLKASHNEANKIALQILDMFQNNEFDTCIFSYVKFKNALKQSPVNRKLIPLNEELGNHSNTEKDNNFYEYEPGEKFMLNHILPMNLTVQVYYMMLETIASEHGARTSAMDSATKNAKEMIADLTLLYNRSRQAAITRELIEIVSSAEVV